MPAVAAGTSRQVEQTVVCSLWWGPLPVHVEAGAGIWELCPCPPRTSQQWHRAFQADHASSRAFPATHPLTPVPSAVSVQPTALLPGSVVPTPTLQHSAPASIGGLPSQTVVPRADSQGGFGMDGAQVPRAHAGGGDPAPRGGQARSDGSPSQCLQRQRSWRVGKGVVMVAHPLCTTQQ